MTIKQIRAFTLFCNQEDFTIEQRLNSIVGQRTASKEQITGLQDVLDVLKYKTRLYEMVLFT